MFSIDVDARKMQLVKERANLRKQYKEINERLWEIDQELGINVQSSEDVK